MAVGESIRWDAEEAPGEEEESGGVRRRERRRAGPEQTVLRRASRRVRGLAGPGGVVFVAAVLLLSVRPLQDAGLEVVRGPVAGAAFLLGLAFWGVSRSSRVRARVRADLGLLFQVLIAFALAWLEAPRYVGADVQLFGVSVLCVWQLFFPVAVAARARKVAVAAVATTGTLPAMAGLLGLLGHPIDWGAVGVSTAPVLICGALGVGVRVVLSELTSKLAEVRSAGSYQLKKPLRTGAMGEVWLAEHGLLQRPAVVKFIKASPDSDPDDVAEFTERFQREARATAALRSPHTVELYDYGVASDGSVYYVMEKLEGFDLGELVKRFGPQPPGRVVHLIRQVCMSLREAHARGLIHRDIKPANIYTCAMGATYDVAKVLDFGLVRATERATEPNVDFATMTLVGTTLGTPSTLAPEAIEGAREADARADLYGLGCVAYWLLTGKRIFEGRDKESVLIAHLDEVPMTPSQRLGATVPGDLEKVVMRCLAKKPGDRPQSARELLEALECCEAFHDWSAEHAEMWWIENAPSLVVWAED